MTVYGVYSGCKYEGGSVRAVFSTEEKAREYALAMVENENFNANLNHQYNQASGYTYGSNEIDLMLKGDGDYWENGSDTLSIIEFEVDRFPSPFQDLIDQRARSLEWHKQAMEDLQKKDDEE
jgi:hypothetical protein